MIECILYVWNDYSALNILYWYNFSGSKCCDGDVPPDVHAGPGDAPVQPALSWYAAVGVREPAETQVRRSTLMCLSIGTT